ncbi:type II toxin-antitoxin system prevent-host-death family antitoxin [Actinacidiphila oryziradicis]|uniref:Antitoxin n=1 Tax=Actinacidiphila oryziradicis TaxID=2571141 RepID=A0A4U0RYW4_9ACTN|nr:type II toxin-antitoxin system prevent-host-death family antitoxin [Actinacidiphila oryziradicis]TJZ93554.1 type II toxin-antitoxin system prevent-host-death family antitoxin [Actinacidiphila oryziradicis]
MSTYTAKMMRSNAGQMLDQARRGEEVVITRRGAERFVLLYEPEGSAHSGEHPEVSTEVTTALAEMREMLAEVQEAVRGMTGIQIVGTPGEADTAAQDRFAEVREVIAQKPETAQSSAQPSEGQLRVEQMTRAQARKEARTQDAMERAAEQEQDRREEDRLLNQGRVEAMARPNRSAVSTVEESAVTSSKAE